VRQLGLAPPDFWVTDPLHFWWLVESLHDEAGKKPGGKLMAADYDDLLQMMDDADG